MRYYLPDSNDKVDPSFDFINETRAPDRLSRDDHYAHEVFDTRPYDGILISYAVITKGIYSATARRRLLRSGVREFFRAPKWASFMGDCGAFAYKNEDVPPVTVADVAEFYGLIEVDYGISVDHIVSEYVDSAGEVAAPSADAQRRYDMTLALARDFMQASKAHYFTPIGAVQGWSPATYAAAARDLQRMGYRYLAIGGLVRLRATQRDHILSAVHATLRPESRVHLLGVGQPENLASFAERGVASIDSTSPLRRAWMDARKNYHLGAEAYAALRVPDSNSPRVSKKIASGEIPHGDLLRRESLAMSALADFAARRVSVATVLAALLDYQALHSPGVDRRKDYTRTLEARPWERCSCPICKALGHHVVVFRGAERNRRRGFHNVAQFYTRVQVEMGSASCAA